MQRKQSVRIIPELAVRDKQGAARMLTQVFGFRVEDAGEGLLSLGDQHVALVSAGDAGHGVIDHLALAVADVDLALAECLSRGGRIEGTTPDGPREIAEFWQTGVRYVFVEGPEGARIEFCARLGVGPRDGLPGHDHIGIPCTDLAATEGFFLSLGLAPITAVDLRRADGVTKVRFLSAGQGVVELYEPPGLRGASAPFATAGRWQGLRLIGAAGAAGHRIGPDGLRVTLM